MNQFFVLSLLLELNAWLIFGIIGTQVIKEQSNIFKSQTATLILSFVCLWWLTIIPLLTKSWLIFREWNKVIVYDIWKRMQYETRFPFSMCNWANIALFIIALYITTIFWPFQEIHCAQDHSDLTNDVCKLGQTIAICCLITIPILSAMIMTMDRFDQSLFLYSLFPFQCIFSNTCSICFTPLNSTPPQEGASNNVIVLTCHDRFHETCISIWKLSCIQCPQCNKTIS